MPGTTLAETERRLWSSADQLRANPGLRAADYSAPVLGFILLRFADYKFALAEQELRAALPPGSRRTIDRTDYQARGLLYLPPEVRFGMLLALPKSYNQPGLDREVLVTLLRTFDDIPLTLEGDVFGKIYEYFR